MDRHTLPTKIIHYSQRPETSSVKQVIRHEIHTPALIDSGQDRTLLTMCCTDMPAGALFAQVEAFQTVNPVCFPVVNRPAFPPQLNMNTRETVAPLFTGYAGLSPDHPAGSASGKRFCSASAVRIPVGH